MLGPDWQLVSSDTGLDRSVRDLLPVGFAVMGFVSKGALYPAFEQLLGACQGLRNV